MVQSSRQVVEQSFGLLWDAIKGANEEQMNDDHNTLSCFEERLRYLDDLQDEITREMCRLRRLRNQFGPMHRLPTELFTYILLLSVNPWNWQMESLRVLASVSARWHNTILSSSLFWPKVDSAFGDKVNATVLRHNPGGPLSVVCRGSVDRPFLHEIKRTSDRWQSLRIESNGELDEPLSTLVGCYSPKLEDLFVTSDRSSHTLALSKGDPFRNVHTSGVGLPWDSSRLTQLRSLAIPNLHGNLPSATQLLRILSTCPKLSHLILRGWTGPIPDDDKLPYPVSVPSLTTLVIQDTPSQISRPVVLSIRTSRCECIILDDILPVHLSPPTPLARLIEQATVGTREHSLTYDLQDRCLRLLSSPEPITPSSWRDGIGHSPGVDLRLTIDASDREGWKSITDYFVSTPSGVRKLRIRGTYGGEPAVPPAIPFDIISWLPSITSLEFRGNCDPVPSLQHLSRRHIVSPANEESLEWPLPNLKTLALFNWLPSDGVYAVVQSIVEFAQGRYSADSQPPARLATLQARAAIVDRLTEMHVLGDILRY